jgi:hypothetical protein
LRDWIDPQYRESNLGAQPIFKNVQLDGADAVMIARFIENIVGLPKEHMRIVIVVAGGAAIIDVSVTTAVSRQRIMRSVEALLNSVSVVTDDGTDNVPNVAESPAKSRVAAQGGALSGIFMGYNPKLTVNLNGPVGSGTFPPAPYFYLLSPDGRAYRTFDIQMVPKGNPTKFDYASATRTDPDNSGRFAVRGNQLIMRFGRGGADTLTATMSSEDMLTTYGVTYSRW